MATPHIAAEPGDFAPAVLMPGDPKRAQRIADAVLDEPRLVTDVRGMLGFTGTHEGRPLSVMGSGMGQPSTTLDRPLASCHAASPPSASAWRRISRPTGSGRWWPPPLWAWASTSRI
mgnify:CR=1 FL=1